MLKELSRHQTRSLSQLSLTKCFGHFHTPSGAIPAPKGSSTIDRRYLKIEELRSIFRNTNAKNGEKVKESKKLKKHIKGRAKMPVLMQKQAEGQKLVCPQSQGRNQNIPEKQQKLTESKENSPFGSLHMQLVPIHQSQHKNGTVNKELMTRIKCERRKQSIPETEQQKQSASVRLGARVKLSYKMPSLHIKRDTSKLITTDTTPFYQTSQPFKQTKTTVDDSSLSPWSDREGQA